MYIIYTPNKNFSGKVGDFKFKNGECITKLSDNDKKWFEKSGYFVYRYKKTIKDEEIKENVEEEIKDK